MAPELWKGEKADHRVRRICAGRDAVRTGGERSPLSQRDPWQDRSKHKPPALRHGWDFIMQKCLEVDPAKRYRDASEVTTALEPSRALRWWLAAAAAIVLAVVSGLISFERARAPKETVRLAVLPFEASSDLAPLATNLTRDAARELGHLKGNSQTRIDVINSRKDANRALRVKLETAKGERENSDITLHASLMDTGSGATTKDWTLRYKRPELRYAPEALAGMVSSVLHIPPPVTHRR